MKHKSWIIKENKDRNGPDSPHFFVDYDRRGKTAENQTVSYQLISRLKRDAALVIKLDSSSFNLPMKQRDDLIFELIEEVKSMGLEYRYRKYLGPPAPNLWNQLLMFRKEESHHEIIIFIPELIWVRLSSLDSALCSSLGYGTFYYICKDPGQGSEILDAFFQGRISTVNQSEYFTLSIFDWIRFGQMGLFTDSHTLADLKALLKMV